MSTVHTIFDPREWEGAVSEIARHSVVVVDTEFANGYGRNSTPCLIQMCTGEDTYLFDLLFSDPSLFQSKMLLFKQILENPDITTVYFDCREDSDLLFFHGGVDISKGQVVDLQVLEPLVSIKGQSPASYFSQQVESGRGGWNKVLCMGLVKYAEQKLHQTEIPEGWKVDKNKNHDWTQRPLPKNCLDYAKNDVEIIFKIFQKVKVERSPFMNDLKTYSKVYSTMYRELTRTEADNVYSKNAVFPFYIFVTAAPHERKKCPTCLFTVPISFFSKRQLQLGSHGKCWRCILRSKLIEQERSWNDYDSDWNNYDSDWNDYDSD